MITALLIKPKAFADWWLYIEYEIKMKRPETDWCIKYYQNQRLVVDHFITLDSKADSEKSNTEYVRQSIFICQSLRQDC